MYWYCRYHLLKPEYIHHRIKELQRSFRLRLILCHVDTDDAVEPLAQVRGQGRWLPALPSAPAATAGWSHTQSVTVLCRFWLSGL
jgi:hypothetical protein